MKKERSHTLVSKGDPRNDGAPTEKDDSKKHELLCGEICVCIGSGGAPPRTVSGFWVRNWFCNNLEATLSTCQGDSTEIVCGPERKVGCTRWLKRRAFGRPLKEKQKQAVQTIVV